MSAVISAHGLGKCYGKFRALEGVNLSIGEGRIVGLIGPNGAGKTTLLNAILGLSQYEGELTVLGYNPMSERDKLMREVCFIADVAVMPGWLKVNQALDFLQQTHPRFDRSRAESFLATTVIKPKARVRTLSKGMKTQLHLALAMAIDARLLVLDEPTLGLDILYRKEFYSRLLNEYFESGRTILVTTHQVEEVEHILSDLIFIRQGKLILDTTMEALGERFIEVLVAPAATEAARALGPIHEQEVFGRRLMLFRDRPRQDLAALGELRTPGVADLFVALMKGEQA